MFIKISELPKDIQDRIPPSIKLEKDEWQIDELPADIQYYVYRYLQEKPPEVEYQEDIYDTTPVLSTYNDITGLTLRESVLEYLKNFLLVRVGSYPFDVTFGSRLKEYLQTKDTELKRTLIQHELINICKILTDDYKVPVKILKATVRNQKLLATEADVYSEYFLDIDVEIDGTRAKLTV